MLSGERGGMGGDVPCSIGRPSLWFKSALPFSSNKVMRGSVHWLQGDDVRQGVGRCRGMPLPLLPRAANSPCGVSFVCRRHSWRRATQPQLYVGLACLSAGVSNSLTSRWVIADMILAPSLKLTIGVIAKEQGDQTLVSPRRLLAYRFLEGLGNSVRR